MHPAVCERRPLKRIKQQDVEPDLPNRADAGVDDAVANFFVGTGTPFHISRCATLAPWARLCFTLYPAALLTWPCDAEILFSRKCYAR